MSNKLTTTIVILACVILIVSLFAFGKRSEDAVIDQKLTRVEESGWKKGAENGAVTIVAYEDYFCGACRNFYETINKLIEKYPDDLTFVFRHFPLNGTHENSFDVAVAAEAAGMQGKFWEMNDKIMEAEDLEKDSLEKMAAEIGLDIDQYRYDIEDPRTIKLVNEDIASGNDVGVPYTPYIIINGEVWDTNSLGFSEEILSGRIEGILIPMAQ